MMLIEEKNEVIVLDIEKVGFQIEIGVIGQDEKVGFISCNYACCL